MSVGCPVITGWSAVSPFGAGGDAFAEGVLSGRDTAAAPGEQWAVPDSGVCLVPDYDPKALVAGRVGRSTDRATVFALAIVGHLVERSDEPDDRTGVVLGTTVGSLRNTMTICRESLVGRKPHHVDTKMVPTAVMNYPAAQCAIRYGLTGPNTTIAGGPGAGLFALAYANRLIAAGRADRVLAGAVEEYSAERAWLNRHNDGGVLGEGGVVFGVESASSAGMADIVALHSRVALGSGDHDVAEALRATVATLLTQADATPADVWAVVPAGGTEPERAVTSGMFGDYAGTVLGRVPGAGLIGDTGAAAAAFAVAAALCSPGPSGRLVLVLSGEPDGSAVAVLLRVKGN